MIQVKCPHCKVGLKVDERKIPKGINSFKCPQCKYDIPLSSLAAIKKEQRAADETDTVVFQSAKAGYGKLTVLSNAGTKEQVFHLQEGHFIAGRKSSVSEADIRIETEDKMMSRNHARIDVRKDSQGGLMHCLSDNQSKNRTMYNGVFLDEGEEVVLQDNDEIKLGNTLLRFNV
jgi:hypothetical protein